MKKLFFKTTIENTVLNEVSMTVLRIVMGLLMATLHGLGKMPPSEKFMNGVQALGFPLPVVFAWAAALTELFGGIFIAIGLFTRFSAIMLAVTMFVAAFGKHIADPLDVKETSLLYFTIAIVFAVRGAGRWSVDNLIHRR